MEVVLDTHQEGGGDNYTQEMTYYGNKGKQHKDSRWMDVCVLSGSSQVDILNSSL